MFPQEKYDIMDWVSYGAQKRREGKLEGMREGKLEGERNQLERVVRRMYAEGVKPDIISRFTEASIERVKEILSRQPNAPVLL